MNLLAFLIGDVFMAKVSIRMNRPAVKKRPRVTVHQLMKLFNSLELSDIRRELRKLNPSRQVLLSLFTTLQTLKASSEVQDVIQAYCQERGCDPSQPPIAKHVHKKPVVGDRRVYNVQYSAEDRPYVRVPLDPTGRPDQVVVDYASTGKVVIEPYVLT